MILINTKGKLLQLKEKIVGLLKYVFGGLLILAGLVIIFAFIVPAIFSGNLWMLIIAVLVGFIIILIGRYLMRR